MGIHSYCKSAGCSFPYLHCKVKLPFKLCSTFCHHICPLCSQKVSQISSPHNCIASLCTTYVTALLLTQLHAVQAELEATRSDMILYRESLHSLLEAVQSKARGHFYLTGPSFSGKSIALAAVVSAMRAKGWLVSLLSTHLCMENALWQQASTNASARSMRSKLSRTYDASLVVASGAFMKVLQDCSRQKK